jgi:hypothetical protein
MRRAAEKLFDPPDLLGSLDILLNGERLPDREGFRDGRLTNRCADIRPDIHARELQNPLQVPRATVLTVDDSFGNLSISDAGAVYAAEEVHVGDDVPRDDGCMG